MDLISLIWNSNSSCWNIPVRTKTSQILLFSISDFLQNIHPCIICAISSAPLVSASHSQLVSAPAPGLRLSADCSFIQCWDSVCRPGPVSSRLLLHSGNSIRELIYFLNSSEICIVVGVCGHTVLLCYVTQHWNTTQIVSTPLLTQKLVTDLFTRDKLGWVSGFMSDAASCLPDTSHSPHLSHPRPASSVQMWGRAWPPESDKELGDPGEKAGRGGTGQGQPGSGSGDMRHCSSGFVINGGYINASQTRCMVKQYSVMC